MFHVKHFRFSFAFQDIPDDVASGILSGAKNVGILHCGDSVQNDSLTSAEDHQLSQIAGAHIVIDSEVLRSALNTTGGTRKRSSDS